MRAPRKIMIAATTFLAAVSVAAPPASANARAETTTPYEYRGYHGLNHTKMISIFPATSADLRPVTFSIGLQKSTERYAMFWDNKPGPDWTMEVELRGSAAYQKRFDQVTANGYQPTVVTATGSGPNTVFTAIYEKKTGKFIARHGIGIPEFLLANTDANRNGYIPVSVNLYGTASSPRVAAVWAANPSGVSWHFTLSDSASEYQRIFNINVKRGYRPSAITVTPDGKGYLTIWRKDTIGAWYAFHGMSAAQYQARFDEMTAKGLYPTWIDMENGVYAAIFTRR
ncbi:hypothetical protein [Sphaerimonospora thailandensis]|uniref:Uncharacterized protein n=1 Tax=Sphaerimonospora thailandensis TaxID=795644 RepID=A0A8J3RE07_9ACTN|nr:hypothetical protein [Sphaerimonospora thailandensis]GIH72945.1 hypothetical protein Mth01_51980 [Sphaerimonospora thailandensis]